jgi:hypothetical protein
MTREIPCMWCVETKKVRRALTFLRLVYPSLLMFYCNTEIRTKIHLRKTWRDVFHISMN